MVMKQPTPSIDDEDYDYDDDNEDDNKIIFTRHPYKN
jgi:hypothetical protein